MRALVQVGPGDLQWQDLPDPEPPPHGAVVRPLAVARCDLDPAMAALGLFPGPYTVGHELVGRVERVGEDVGLAVGSRVCVPFQVSCGTCEACLGGRTAACTTYRAPAGAAFGFGERGGGHGGAVADALVVPHADHLLVPAPTGVSDIALATVPDNAVDAYRAVGPHLAARPGAEVLVLGGAAPSIGLYAVALAVTLGAGTVRYLDADAGRCAVAERLGAAVEQLEGGWPRQVARAPVVVDTTADQDGLLCAIRSTQDRGVLSVLGIVFGEVTVPLLEMYTRGITLHTSRADSRHHLPAVLDLITQGDFDPLVVPVSAAPFDAAAEVWLQPSIKLVLTRD